MSGQTTGWVLRNGPTPETDDRSGVPYGLRRARGLRAVLVTIADAANRDGEHSHPGLAAIVDGSLYSERQAARLLADLLAENWITVEEQGGGRGHATVYAVNVDRETMPSRHPSGDGNHAIPDEKHCHPGDEKVTDRTVAPPSSTDSNGEATVYTDANRLADLLADLIEANGSKRPNVTKRWVDEIDRMIRLDERTPEQIENCVRWAQGHSFWRGNILSPSKLRAKYDQLRLQAIHERNGGRSKDPVAELHEVEFDDDGRMIL